MLKRFLIRLLTSSVFLHTYKIFLLLLFLSCTFFFLCSYYPDFINLLLGMIEYIMYKILDDKVLRDLVLNIIYKILDNKVLRDLVLSFGIYIYYISTVFYIDVRMQKKESSDSYKTSDSMLVVLIILSWFIWFIVLFVKWVENLDQFIIPWVDAKAPWALVVHFFIQGIPHLVFSLYSDILDTIHFFISWLIKIFKK